MTYTKENIDYDKLLLKSVNGDKTAFFRIVKDWKDPMLNFFYQNLHNFEIAEELTQDLFVSIWKLKSHTDKGYFSTWIYRIARNKLIDYSRKKRVATESINDDKYFLEIQDNKKGIEEIILEKENGQIINDVLSGLPDEEKNLLILSQLHDLPLSEIAKIMDCSLNSIKGKVFRAVKKFCKKFKELETNAI